MADGRPAAPGSKRPNDQGACRQERRRQKWTRAAQPGFVVRSNVMPAERVVAPMMTGHATQLVAVRQLGARPVVARAVTDWGAEAKPGIAMQPWPTQSRHLLRRAALA